MTTYAFRIVNVFAETPLAGNPLCVFEDARGLDDATMQALALQFNLSETTFVLPSHARDARTCASSRRRSRCRSPGIRRSAPRTSCATLAGRRRRGHARDDGRRHPGRRARRRVDAAGECAEASRARGVARRACGDARPREADDVAARRRCGSTRAPSSSSFRSRPPSRRARAAPRADLHAAHGSNATSARWRTCSRRGRRTATMRPRALLLSQARRGDRGPRHRLGVRQPRRLAARDRRRAAAAPDDRAGRRGRPAVPARSRGHGRSPHPRVRPRDRARPRASSRSDTTSRGAEPAVHGVSQAQRSRGLKPAPQGSLPFVDPYGQASADAVRARVPRGDELLPVRRAGRRDASRARARSPSRIRRRRARRASAGSAGRGDTCSSRRSRSSGGRRRGALPRPPRRTSLPSMPSLPGKAAQPRHRVEPRAGARLVHREHVHQVEVPRVVAAEVVVELELAVVVAPVPVAARP